MTHPALQELRALDVASVLERLAPGADVELAPSEAVTLERLVAGGLVVRVPDLGPRRAELDAKKTELAAMSVRGADPSAIAAQRRAILDLSEALTSVEGAALVRTRFDGGPYRGAEGERATYALTQAGRALLSNLGPRAARAPELMLPQFLGQLAALDGVLAMRVQRAAALVSRVQAKTADTLPLHALRSAMLGLASLPHATDVLADAFVVLFTGIRQTIAQTSCSAAQDAAAAEGVILQIGDPSVAYHRDVPSSFVSMRDDVAARFCAGRSEDALDAVLVLGAVAQSERQPRIDEAARFARGMAQIAKVPTPLSVALLATAGGPAGHLVGAVGELHRALLGLTSEPLEALTAAVLVAIQSSRAIDTQLARVRELHAYLTRVAPSGMLVGAALLALLDGEPAGLLDDLRLASKHVQEQRLVPGGAEATALGLKLLLHSALLARGSEGDPEERLALAVRALPDVAAFELGAQGLGTMSATLPLLTSSVLAFHRPMLDATVLYAEHARPMHSSYVFGGGGGGGYHPSSHRSFGWG